MTLRLFSSKYLILLEADSGIKIAYMKVPATYSKRQAPAGESQGNLIFDPGRSSYPDATHGRRAFKGGQ
jgi:hypothetical protein